MSYLHYVLLFFIYAFMGWCTEVVYATVNTGKFVNRGFLNGPICPVYGFGLIIVTQMLTPLNDNIFLLFAGSVLLTSTLEWITGWALEKTFHQKWWDYSDVPYNLNGYICLKFSLIWGLACILVINIIHPIVLEFISFLDFRVIRALNVLFIAYIIIDITATVQSILKLNKQLKRLNEMGIIIRNMSDEIGEKISNNSISVMEYGEKFKDIMEESKNTAEEALKDKKAFANELIIDFFEDSKSIANEFIEEFKDNIENLWDDVEEQKDNLSQKMQKSKVRIIGLADKRDKIINKTFFGERRLLHAFPSMKSSRYKEALEELRQKLMDKK